MTIHLGQNYGIHVRRMSGSTGRMYLSAVIWFRRSRHPDRLGYWYPSIRWF